MRREVVWHGGCSSHRTWSQVWIVLGIVAACVLMLALACRPTSKATIAPSTGEMEMYCWAGTDGGREVMSCHTDATICASTHDAARQSLDTQSTCKRATVRAEVLDD